MITHAFGAPQLSPAAFYTLTYTSLFIIYLLAVCIQSAYAVRAPAQLPACKRRQGAWHVACAHAAAAPIAAAAD